MKKMITLCMLLFGVLTLTPCITHATTLDATPTQIMDTSMGIAEADVTAPTVTGLKGLSVVNEDTDLSKNVPASTDICTFTNKNVMLKITDPSGVAAIVLNGEELISTGQVTAITDGYQLKVTKQDSYLLGVADMNGNVAWYRFVIDKKKPVIKMYDDYYYERSVYLGDQKTPKKELVKNWGPDPVDYSKQIWFNFIPEIYASDTFQFSDKNQDTYSSIKSIMVNGVEVDLTKPILLDPEEDFSLILSEDELGFPVLLPATINDPDVLMKDLLGYGKREHEFKYIDHYYPENGKYVIKVTDMAGNVAQKTINIDRTPPVATISAKKGTMYEDEYASEQEGCVFDPSLSGKYGVGFYDYYYEAGYYIVTKVTNPVTLTWDPKDVVSATFEGFLNEDDSMHCDENSIRFNKDVTKQKKVTIKKGENTAGTLTLVDKAGNKTYIYIDHTYCSDKIWNNRKEDYINLVNQPYLIWKKTK